MKRVRLWSVAVGLIVLVGAGGYALRNKAPGLAALFRRASAPAPVPADLPPADLPGNSTQEPASTPRGDVTIDSRRQQLIGVRTVAALKTTLTPTIRTVGSVRSAETRLTDVNVKV